MSIEGTMGKSPDRMAAILRGLRHRCPRCGQGHLFRSYLKLADRCDACGEPFGSIRADDGPAWATIIVVGHLVIPFFLIAVRNGWPDWTTFGLLLPLTFLLTVALLPRFKGVFAGILWSMAAERAVAAS